MSLVTAFDQALAFVLGWEGGLVNDPKDPGGLTNHGISKLAYPALDVAALTREQIVEIYRRDYWEPARCMDMPVPLALLVFDSAVNQGISTAVKCLQRACEVEDDGAAGPRTMLAAHAGWTLDPGLLLREMALQRLLHYSAIPGWATYRVGWSRRLLDALRVSVGMLGRG